LVRSISSKILALGWPTFNIKLKLEQEKAEIARERQRKKAAQAKAAKKTVKGRRMLRWTSISVEQTAGSMWSFQPSASATS